MIRGGQRMTAASLPVVVGGSPGCGKTTLCALLSQQDDNGVHLRTDDFFGYIAHCVDPSTPESHQQNEAVKRSYCAAARAFVDAGYTVYIDGVVGPWHLRDLASELGPYHYILLHSPLDVTISRMFERTTQGSAHPSIAERMHPQFEALLGEYAHHVVMSDAEDPEALAERARNLVQSEACIVHAS